VIAQCATEIRKEERDESKGIRKTNLRKMQNHQAQRARDGDM
jgi:hypothetical protein